MNLKSRPGQPNMIMAYLYVIVSLALILIIGFIIGWLGHMVARG